MDNLIKILVVEDEMIIGSKICMQLTSLGYDVTGILPRGEEAILHLKENNADETIHASLAAKCGKK